VSKLVAGPKVFICDSCVAEASRIMSDPGAPGPAKAQSPVSSWRRVRDWLGMRRMTAFGKFSRGDRDAAAAS
jgi:ATP-dependent protease Clp ATPase subunit